MLSKPQRRSSASRSAHSALSSTWNRSRKRGIAQTLRQGAVGHAFYRHPDENVGVVIAELVEHGQREGRRRADGFHVRLELVAQGPIDSRMMAGGAPLDLKAQRRLGIGIVDQRRDFVRLDAGEAGMLQTSDQIAEFPRTVAVQGDLEAARVGAGVGGQAPLGQCEQRQLEPRHGAVLTIGHLERETLGIDAGLSEQRICGDAQSGQVGRCSVGTERAGMQGKTRGGRTFGEQEGRTAAKALCRQFGEQALSRGQVVAGNFHFEAFAQRPVRQLGVAQAQFEFVVIFPPLRMLDLFAFQSLAFQGPAQQLASEEMTAVVVQLIGVLHAQPAPGRAQAQGRDGCASLGQQVFGVGVRLDGAIAQAAEGQDDVGVWIVAGADFLGSERLEGAQQARNVGGGQAAAMVQFEGVGLLGAYFHGPEALRLEVGGQLIAKSGQRRMDEHAHQSTRLLWHGKGGTPPILYRRGG